MTRAVDSAPRSQPQDLMDTATCIWKGGLTESDLPQDFQASLNEYFTLWIYEPVMADIRHKAGSRPKGLEYQSGYEP